MAQKLNGINKPDWLRNVPVRFRQIDWLKNWRATNEWVGGFQGLFLIINKTS
jgi:hypothetical protein